MSFEENDLCDLDKTKVCDNCEKCLGITESDYMEIKLDGVIKESAEFFKEYEDFEVFSEKHSSEEDLIRDYEFLEDHEELREKYNKEISKILEDKE